MSVFHSKMMEQLSLYFPIKHITLYPNRWNEGGNTTITYSEDESCH